MGRRKRRRSETRKEVGPTAASSSSVVSAHALYRVNREEKLALLTPDDLRDGSLAEDTDIESLDLGLYPPPTHFVSYIKNLDRADIAGGVFVRLLEAYRVAKGSGYADAQDGDVKAERQSIFMDPKEPDPLR